MNTKGIEQQALGLQPSKRAELAQKLLLSLDTLSEKEAEEAWLDCAQRRAEELDRGVVQAVPGDEVRRRAQELLR